MLNFAICDDNVNILDKFSKILENIFVKHGYDAKVGISTNDVNKLLDYIDDNKTDVLILDINLKADKSGLEVASKVRESNKDTYFIFTTAHLEYAMMAYKFKTFDYLAKPVTSDRLEETIVRLFDDINGLPKRYLKLDNKKTIIEFLQLIIYLLPFSLSTKICLNDEELFNSKKELKDMIDDYYFKKQQFLKIIGILDEYNAIINNELNSVKKF